MAQVPDHPDELTSGCRLAKGIDESVNLGLLGFIIGSITCWFIVSQHFCVSHFRWHGDGSPVIVQVKRVVRNILVYFTCTNKVHLSAKPNASMKKCSINPHTQCAASQRQCGNIPGLPSSESK